MKCVTAGGEYFEGRHLSITPEDFGVEIVFGESEGESSDSEEDQEQHQDPESDTDQ